MSLARIREEWFKPRIQEADRIEGEDEKGFTFDFNPTGRRKWETILRMIHYSEDPEYKEIAMSGKGYFCANCHYFATDNNSVTGYHCTKYLVPDRPEGCCSGFEKKE